MLKMLMPLQIAYNTLFIFIIISPLFARATFDAAREGAAP